MQSFCGSIRSVRRHVSNSSKFIHYSSTHGRSITSGTALSKPNSLAQNELGGALFYRSLTKPSMKTELLTSYNNGSVRSVSLLHKGPKAGLFHPSMPLQILSGRCITTANNSGDSIAQDATASVSEAAPRIKFKRLDKTAQHIMQIIDKEAVEEVRNQREIPDIKPGYIIQLKVEVPDNKRRVSILKGIVIARRNAGLNTTFRLRRLVAGVGVESLFPLYSPNIKEIKVLDKKKVRRAKLYYLRDKMNPLKK